jgi:hypothetical protein
MTIVSPADLMAFIRESFYLETRIFAALRRDHLLRTVGPAVMVEWWQLFE